MSPFSNLIYKFPIIPWGGLVYKIIDIDHLLYLKIIMFFKFIWIWKTKQYFTKLNYWEPKPNFIIVYFKGLKLNKYLIDEDLIIFKKGLSVFEK